ncbi:response regulator [Dechloromonas sp. ZY10]|uniref:response regulator n=1 Tax=Dechloromonas aquae TaxID=2664436 RepID=UPI00352710B3
MGGIEEHCPAYLLDADPQVADELQPELQRLGFAVTRFACAGDFLARSSTLRRGCLILESELPDLGGLEVQERVNRQALPLYLVYFSRTREVATAVRAIQLGAVDFVCKMQGWSRLQPSLLQIARVLRQPQRGRLRRHPYAPAWPA